MNLKQSQLLLFLFFLLKSEINKWFHHFHVLLYIYSTNLIESCFLQQMEIRDSSEKKMSIFIHSQPDRLPFRQSAVNSQTLKMFTLSYHAAVIPVCSCWCDSLTLQHPMSGLLHSILYNFPSHEGISTSRSIHCHHL